LLIFWKSSVAFWIGSNISGILIIWVVVTSDPRDILRCTINVKGIFVQCTKNFWHVEATRHRSGVPGRSTYGVNS
jgi:hypothetical protein